MLDLNNQVPHSAEYHQYIVWSDGTVFNRNSGKFIKFTMNKATGYLQACFRVNGFAQTVYLHRLLAELFIGNPDNLPQVNHINGDKQDNRIENLEWVSRIDNMRHFYEQLLPIGKYSRVNDIQREYSRRYCTKKREYLH